MCASPSCAAAVRDVCQKRVSELTSAIPSVVFEVLDASGHDVREVRVTMDGRVLTDRLDGTAIDLDPGDHTFSFAAQGQPILERTILLYEGQKQRSVEIRIGSPAASAEVPSRGGIAIALAGVGGASVVAGSVLGALTISAWSSAKSACGVGGTGQCAPRGVAPAEADRSRAETEGALSTVLFIAGGGLVAAGVAVWWMGGRVAHREAPQAISLAPTLGPGQAGLALRGAF
jgi:hypothetical protein